MSSVSRLVPNTIFWGHQVGRSTACKAASCSLQGHQEASNIPKATSPRASVLGAAFVGKRSKCPQSIPSIPNSPQGIAACCGSTWKLLDWKCQVQWSGRHSHCSPARSTWLLPLVIHLGVLTRSEARSKFEHCRHWRPCQKSRPRARRTISTLCT